MLLWKLDKDSSNTKNDNYEKISFQISSYENKLLCGMEEQTGVALWKVCDMNLLWLQHKTIPMVGNFRIML
jgi:hypothetical protein